jgi:hypothetical protein
MRIGVPMPMVANSWLDGDGKIVTSADVGGGGGGGGGGIEPTWLSPPPPPQPVTANARVADAAAIHTLRFIAASVEIRAAYLRVRQSLWDDDGLMNCR